MWRNYECKNVLLHLYHVYADVCYCLPCLSVCVSAWLLSRRGFAVNSRILSESILFNAESARPERLSIRQRLFWQSWIPHFSFTVPICIGAYAATVLPVRAFFAFTCTPLEKAPLLPMPFPPFDSIIAKGSIMKHGFKAILLSFPRLACSAFAARAICLEV